MSIVILALLFFPAVFIGQALGVALASAVCALYERYERWQWNRHPEDLAALSEALKRAYGGL